jgi:hypothetical protein
MLPQVAIGTSAQAAPPPPSNQRGIQKNPGQTCQVRQVRQTRPFPSDTSIPVRSVCLEPAALYWLSVGTRFLGFLPLLFALMLAAVGALQKSTSGPILAAALLLGLWNVALVFSGREANVQVDVRRQHYLQACAQSSVLLYWGWYWHPVYEWLPYLLAQVLFAYAFDLLLSWSRRGSATLGFGPFPIVFSINLFLWFKPDWIAAQLLLVAVGLLAKEFLRWNRDGRRGHIFNPSSFPLALASVGLLLTNNPDMTLGQQIATTQFYPPHMYLWLFLIGLPGQFFFGVTTMTMSAVLTTYLAGQVYFAATGIYFFYDSYVPIAVFLGMHLLFTDPSTSPRSELGRIFYGAFYGLTTMGLYQGLGMLGLPTFYDKLLQVPVMNLLVPSIDRIFPVGERQHKMAYMTGWAVAFAALYATQGVGDQHPGQWLPFWRQACDDQRAYACSYLADVEVDYCNRGSAWACNEAGLLHVSLSRSGEDQRRADPGEAAPLFERSCRLDVAVGCENLRVLTSNQGDFVAVQPTLADFPIILQGSKGPLPDVTPTTLTALACRQGWTGACPATP